MKCNDRTSPKRSCAPKRRGNFLSLEDIIEDYIVRVRPDAAAELSYYGSRPSLAETIRIGANGIYRGEKRHDHQRRIPAQSLATFAQRLLDHEPDIRACKSFSKLHDLLANLSKDIYRVGPLTVYDTATRIGAKRRLFPREVYLHAGTSQGALALGIDSGLKTASLSIFPDEFNRLEPYEVEDVLCIYKKELRKLAQGMRSRSTRNL
ncbi:MAG: hypothetical protein H8K03_12055 [Nitrospira sp.]